MQDFNRITICRDNYKSEDEFDNAIKTAVKLLLEAEYIMTVKYDDKSFGIVCIDFNYADESMGCDYPYWLSPDDEVVKANEKCEENI